MSSNDTELRMYFVVNNDLKMGRGKIASQVGHAAMMMTEHMLGTKRVLYNEYKRCGMPKIILKADQVTIESLSELTSFIVKDAGRTQVDPGTLTVIGFLPMTDETKRKSFHVLDKLKLL